MAGIIQPFCVSLLYNRRVGRVTPHRTVMKKQVSLDATYLQADGQIDCRISIWAGERPNFSLDPIVFVCQ